jgi:hypothetical protein
MIKVLLRSWRKEDVGKGTALKAHFPVSVDHVSNSDQATVDDAGPSGAISRDRSMSPAGET